MALRQNISFKEREADLYQYLIKKKSPSAFVKELIEKAKQEEEQKKNPIKQQSILEF